jgi:two-component system sensor histidine kinase/response regulator
VRNITQRKRAEEALRKSEHLMRLIADNSPAYIAYVSTHDLCYQFVNQKFEPAFNMPQEEILGRHIRDVIGESNYQFAMKYIEEVKSGVPVSYVNVFNVKEGKRWVQVNYVPDFDQHGRVKGIVVFSYDVTETKSAEERLRESERRLSQIIDFLPDPTFAIDSNGRVIIWNKAVEQMTGIGAQDMLGKGDHEYAVPFYGERRPVLADLVLHRNKDVEQKYLEIRDPGEGTLVSESYHPGLRAGGAYIWATATPLCDSEGNVVGAIESLKDITDRVRTREALITSEKQYKTLYKQANETEERYQSLLESTLDAIVTYDMDGRVTFVNNAFTETFGWLKEELADGVPYTPESEKEITMRNVMQVIHEGIPLKDFETKRYRKDRNTVDVEISASRFNDHVGNPAGMVVILRDISERKRAEKDLAEALETAEQLRDKAQTANRAKSEFVANMSHEIRTPLNAIMGMTDLALRGELSPKLRDYLSKIHTSSQSLLRIVNDILDFSKIDAGRLDIESVPFDLRDIISSICDVVSASEACRDIEFLISLDPHVPHALIGDPLRLEQVITNLVGNAVKFTHSGEVVVKVERVEVPGEKVNLRFSVSDTGIGISEDEMATLFNPFTQADGSTTRRFGGSGLGLTICKRLVNMMGGHIQVESEPGKGSVFSLVLAFDRQPEVVADQIPTPAELCGMRVLVVDDNETSQEILLAILESQSFDAFAVGSGEEALDELVSEQPKRPYHLVLLDWRMPGLDGIETALKIDREWRLSGRIPKIIMVTAFGSEEIRSRAEEIGLDGFLSKPVQPSFLLDTIMDVFGTTGPRISKTAQTTAQKAMEAGNIRGASILIAEDNEINQQVAKEILEYAGATVKIVWNGREAVEALNDAEFDAVLMDIQMLEMDGFEATRVIRSDGRYKDLPIIAMTAHAMTGDREKCLQEGMNDHITKPIDSVALIGTIVKWLPKCREDSTDPLPAFAKEPRDADGELPETLPGIDLKRALGRLEGNGALLINLLLRFGRHYAGEVKKIRGAWNSGEKATARFHCHTLKGVAANIGAGDLSHMADRLEKMVEDCSEEEFCQTTEALESELLRVVDSCRSIRDLDGSTQYKAARGTEKSGKSSELGAIEPIVRELDELLDRRNSRARRIAKELVQALEGAECSDAVARLQKRVSALDFDNARNSLRSLAEKLGIVL